MRLTTLYRISDGGYAKVKLKHATKIHCLKNYLKVFGNDGLVVFADKCKPETIEGLRVLGVKFVEITAGSSARSWRLVARYALEKLSSADFVYFLEDDYLHRPNSKEVLAEGLEIGDYVTLYDHPDKYFSPKQGGNPLVREGGEETRVLLTKSTHWKLTNSTTMTFAARVSTLQADKLTWWWFTRGRHPHDFRIFKALTGSRLLRRRRRLLSPIPGYSTHVENAFLAPITDWTRV